jgi:hypothetical protein
MYAKRWIFALAYACRQEGSRKERHKEAAAQLMLRGGFGLFGANDRHQERDKM